MAAALTDTCPPQLRRHPSPGVPQGSQEPALRSIGEGGHRGRGRARMPTSTHVRGDRGCPPFLGAVASSPGRSSCYEVTRCLPASAMPDARGTVRGKPNSPVPGLCPRWPCGPARRPLRGAAAHAASGVPQRGPDPEAQPASRGGQDPDGTGYVGRAWGQGFPERRRPTSYAHIGSTLVSSLARGP